MNESDATEQTTVPAAGAAAGPAEATAAHVHAPAAADTVPDDPAPAAADAAAEAAAQVPESVPEPAAAAQEPAAANEPAVAEEVQSSSAALEPEPAEDAGAAPVEINPAAEPPPAEDAPSAVEAQEPADAEGIAAVEINPAAEPAATEAAAATDVAPSGEPAQPVPAAPAQKQPDPRADERRQRAQQAWERVVSARESGEVLTGTVTAAVKGGLLVDVGGIRGFLPASQVRVPLGTAIDTLVKTKVPLKVIDIDQTRRRIVVSHRRAAEEERRNKRSELLRSLAVGQVREGVVVRLADFGAFVDLGGVDGLIPMRELAFERIDKAGDVVTIGEHLQVEVLRIDENGKKISLSRKNALPDPWRDHADVLRQGSTVQGKVVGKEPRLQVELAPGVVGSVGDRDADPADYEIGEAIEVLVRRVDRAMRRITLTTMHGAAAVPPPQTSSTSSGFAPLGVELGRRP
jgi:4-hydroxy-3-methylbut-2-enyl diphosphate reductase